LKEIESQVKSFTVIEDLTEKAKEKGKLISNFPKEVEIKETRLIKLHKNGIKGVETLIFPEWGGS